MRYASYQPNKDSDFIAWVRHISEQSTQNMTKWQLDETQVAKLNVLTGNAINAYLSNTNRELRNHYTAVQKQAHFKILKIFLRSYLKLMAGNQLIGNADINAMRLPPRTHHSRQPLSEPEDAPNVLTATNSPNTITLVISPMPQGHPLTHMRRKGHYGCIVRYRSEGKTEWKYELSTRLSMTLILDAEEAGHRVVISAAWLNPRLMRGPWSNEITLFVH
ncbi:MAG: hypothetical protein LBT83_10380 [Tannerella sp.]|jgi:hypothetical protein|nr:hypothetical protein [Tannerella sp.]